VTALTHWHRAYARRLGNGDEQSGDGWRYRGRGLIQVTGRGNYRETGAALFLPLEAQPELLEQAANAALSAAWFWKSHLLNPLADHQTNDIEDADFMTITTKINGGMIGLADRRAFWVKARVALGIT
jgi:putative chitinase